MSANLNNLGAIASRMNEIESAIVYYNAALEIRRQIEYHEGIAKTLYNLAHVWAEIGHLTETQTLLEEAVELDRRYGFANLARDQAALERVRRHLA